MCTVQNNNNITKTKLQEFINDNYKKLNMSEEDKEKIIKYIKLRKCKKEIVKIVYFQLCKILEQGPSEKGKHFTYEDRVVLEVLFNAGTPNAGIVECLPLLSDISIHTLSIKRFNEKAYKSL